MNRNPLVLQRGDFCVYGSTSQSFTHGLAKVSLQVEAEQGVTILTHDPHSTNTAFVANQGAVSSLDPDQKLTTSRYSNNRILKYSPRVCENLRSFSFLAHTRHIFSKAILLPECGTKAKRRMRLTYATALDKISRVDAVNPVNCLLK